ncbi:MAG TPA: hypothetical protein VMP68_07685, partial [Candidatus Eisenbacteria bacterium]|nr:hypothetical protein [Candidatus Eisenbacteria bacterium]
MGHFPLGVTLLNKLDCLNALFVTGAAPVGAGNPVAAVDLAFSPGAGRSKFGIWLRVAMRSGTLRTCVPAVRLP